MFSTAFQYFCINFPFFRALHSLSAAFPFLSTKIQNENLYPFGTRPDNERKWYPSRGLSSSSNALRFFFLSFFRFHVCPRSSVGAPRSVFRNAGSVQGQWTHSFRLLNPAETREKEILGTGFGSLRAYFFCISFGRTSTAHLMIDRERKRKLCVCFFCCLSERRVITTLAEHGELIADSLNSDGDTGKDPGGIKLLAAACRRRNWSWRFFHRNSLSVPAKFSLD